MDKVEQFFKTMRETMVATLATAGSDAVSMRAVSPVPYDGSILMFTNAGSRKYAQMQANPHCCIAAGPFFAEADVEFCGPTMADGNAALREAYSEKFPGAFDEGIEFGGRACEFILLHPTRLSGWDFAEDAPAEAAMPTIPFDIDLR